MSSIDLESLTSNLIWPFAILRRNDLHISFTSLSVFNSIRLYVTLPSVSIRSSRNSIFLTFLVSVSNNNSFNLNVRLVRFVVSKRELYGRWSSVKVHFCLNQKLRKRHFLRCFSQTCDPLCIQLRIYYGPHKIIGVITIIHNCRQNTKSPKNKK